MTKILIIEDEPLVRDSIEAVLERENYSVFSAENGQQGLSMIWEHLPDLVLCDVEMPELNGHQVLASLRQHPEMATLPFVFLTGNDARHQMRQGMQLGADDYLTKPFTVDELCATVQTQLEKLQSHQKVTQVHLNDFRQSIASSFPSALMQPLTQVVGISKLLNSDGLALINSPEGHGILHELHQTSQKLQHLTENFILYLQVELMLSDPERLEKFRQSQHSCQPQQVIPEIAQRKAEQYGRLADLSLHIEPANLSVAADDLSKVVDEILDNALHFSDPGTPVELKAVVLSDRFQISISDEGQGFTSEKLADLKISTPVTTAFEPNLEQGLGLTLAQRMLKLYDGQLFLESVPYLATIVRLEFPLNHI